jgi:hypothetical protein
VTSIVLRSGGWGHATDFELRGSHALYDVTQLASDPAVRNATVFDPFADAFEQVPLKQATGLSPDVARMVLANDAAGAFVGNVLSWIETGLTYIDTDELSALVLCRGGRHRSVAFVEEIARHLAADSRNQLPVLRGVGVRVEHLHITKPILPKHDGDPRAAAHGLPIPGKDALEELERYREALTDAGYETTTYNGRITVSRTFVEAAKEGAAQ